MCIMEVRPEQHAATIAQAMAHNTSTVDRDLEMFVELLRARANHDPAATPVLETVLRAQREIHRAYEGLLSVFGEEVASHISTLEGHPHDHGAERTLADVAHHDAELARRFMTR